jgi:hypothetical protein
MKTVKNLHVYDPRSPEFKHLLNHLQNGEVIEASKINWIVYSCVLIYFFSSILGEMSQGTQIKVIMDLPDGFEALFKPYRLVICFFFCFVIWFFYI